jgi:hypothetical protein
MNLFHLNLFLWDRKNCSGLERNDCSGQEASPAEFHSRFRPDRPRSLEWNCSDVPTPLSRQRGTHSSSATRAAQRQSSRYDPVP